MVEGGKLGTSIFRSQVGRAHLPAGRFRYCRPLFVASLSTDISDLSRLKALWYPGRLPRSSENGFSHRVSWPSDRRSKMPGGEFDRCRLRKDVDWRVGAGSIRAEPRLGRKLSDHLVMRGAQDHRLPHLRRRRATRPWWVRGRRVVAPGPARSAGGGRRRSWPFPC